MEENPISIFDNQKYKKNIISKITEIIAEKKSDMNIRRDNARDIFRQDERSSDNLDQSIYPHGWYEKQDSEEIYGKVKN
jgi:endo-alpha-1,4-polygalactosaminidase (GH114 family)